MWFFYVLGHPSVICVNVEVKLCALNWIGDSGGGYVEYLRLSTRGGEGIKIGSKLVHVVVECPPIRIQIGKDYWDLETCK